MFETAFLSVAAGGFTIAFLHAAIPTHWLPFVLTGRAQQWSTFRTLLITAIAGAGHVLITAGLGALVHLGGHEFNEHDHEWFHAVAGGVLVLFGLFYLFRQVSGRGHVHLFGGHHHHHHHHAHGAGHDHEPEVPATVPGPHGGQSVDTGHGWIEARMSAPDGSARVQLYFFPRPGAPALPPPAADDVQLQILRPDGIQQVFHFAPAGDHLQSTETVHRPHEFTAMLDLRHGDHVHRHELVFCEHEHPVRDQGVHAPANEDEAPTPVTRRSDWAAFVALFTMLTLSPCEGFVPVYVSGVPFGWVGFAGLTLVLFLGTVAGMVLFTGLASLGLQRVSLGVLRRYESGLLGLLLCGLGLLLMFSE